MPPQSQISSGLRLLVSPSSPLKPSSLRLSFFSASNLKPSRTLFASLLSSSRRHRSSTLSLQQPIKFASTGGSRGSRSSTSSSFFMGTDNDSSSRKQEREKLEEEGGGGGSNAVGFNKRRAEGRDKSDKPKKNLQLKVRKLNPTNTISYVQILGTGMDTQDTSPSVLLFFDKQRFIFNAGEGLQRFCTEHKIKLSKIDHIFLSRVCSETVGGIPGLLLTLAGMGDEGMTVNIWGPSNLQHLVDAMKSFIPHAAMVHTKSFGSDPAALVDVNKLEPIVLVNDEVVKISAILVQPRCSNASNVKPADVSVIYLCKLPAIMGKFDPEKAKALGLRPGPKYSELQSGKSVKSDRQDIMVNPSDVMGPSVPGPIVVLADCPSEFHAQELLSVQSLNTFYADFPSDPPEGVKTVNCVIHLSPASVTSSPYYQQWMKKFGSAQHIMAGHDMKNVEAPVLISSARIAARLNYLCPQFFPAPGFWSLKHLNNSTSGSIISGEQASVPKYHGGISAENLLKFTLRPYAQLGFDRSNVPITIAPSEVIGELLAEVPEIVDASKQVWELWHGDGQMKGETTVKLDNKAVIEEPWLEENTLPSCLENIRRDDLEIVLLGTGSSQPSKYRNVSSVYINLFSKGSILLDCGEGTLGQLKRRYGVEGADNAVRNLRCIWVSHIHADHHTGLTRLLALRHDLLKGMAHEPLLVIGPRQLKKFLDAYERLEGLDMQFIDCRSTIEGSWDAFDHSIESNKDHSSPGSQNNATEKMNKPAVDIESTLFSGVGPMQSYLKRPGCPVGNGMAFPLLQKLKKVLNEVGLESLVSFPVVHCPQAFGVVLKAAERDNAVGKIIPGWKVVYSGDTRPCPELVRASREATVLIHEATFEDDLAEEAIAKNHTTTKEAIEVGDSAGAYRVILTHFSQRYPKIPVFDETHMHKTCIAFDLMSVNIADLPVLPRVLPYLKLLFRNEMTAEELDQVLGAVSAVS